MKASEIGGRKDMYSSYRPVAFMDDIERMRNGESIVPKKIQFHPQAYCSNSCSFCFYRNSNWSELSKNFLGQEWSKDAIPGDRSRPAGKPIPGVSSLPKEIALDFPRQMAEEGVPAIELTGSGEPTQYEHIVPLFKELARHGIEVAMITHGQSMTDDMFNAMENVKWLRFSVDSCTPETHSKVHAVLPAMWNNVNRNIRKALDKGIKSVYISFVITKDNFHEIVKATQYWKDFGVEAIRFSFEYEPTGTMKLTDEQKEAIKESLKEAHKLEGGGFRVFSHENRWELYHSPNTDFTYCGVQQFSYNVGYDAKVYDCCINIYRPQDVIGDLKKQSLHEIIHWEGRKRFMEKFDVRKCLPCWKREQNKFIETLIAPREKIDNVNFV